MKRIDTAAGQPVLAEMYPLPCVLRDFPVIRPFSLALQFGQVGRRSIGNETDLRQTIRDSRSILFAKLVEYGTVKPKERFSGLKLLTLKEHLRDSTQLQVSETDSLCDVLRRNDFTMLPREKSDPVINESQPSPKESQFTRSRRSKTLHVSCRIVCACVACWFTRSRIAIRKSSLR